MTRSALVLVVVAGLAACSQAPAPTPGPEGESAPAERGDLLLPGSERLAEAPVHDLRQTQTLLRLAEGDSTGDPIGGRTFEIRPVFVDGRPAAWLISGGGNGVMTGRGDSLLIRREGLAPIRERMWTADTTFTFEYDGKRVRATRAVGDSVVRRWERTFDVPVFAFSEVDLLVRSLPLDSGFRLVVPLYSEGSDELEMDTVSMKDPGTGTGRAEIRFADPAIVAVHAVDRETRALVGQRIVARKAGMRMRVTVE